jgi:LuxR family maltose regulon positive regulatory protein
VFRQLEQELAEHAWEQPQTSSTTPLHNPSDLIEPLTERELEILQLIAKGMTNQEIADHLVLTVGTVKTHNYNIYNKLGVKSRSRAIIRANELNLL